MSRVLLAREIAGRLKVAEAGVDAALSAVADLTASLPRAAAGADLPPRAGQVALEQADEALALLVRCRGRMAETHRRLAILARTLGLSDPAIGPLDKPEDDTPPSGADVMPLRRHGAGFPQGGESSFAR